MRRALLTVLTVTVAIPSASGAQSRADLLRLIGQAIPGTVTSVFDGDTVRLRLDGSGQTVRVRLEGVDAPERGEPFGTQARNATRVMLFDKRIRAKASDVDNYDRLVARIIVDGQDSSVQLVESGLACHFTRFANDPSLARAQVTARAAGRGFWASGVQKPACVKFTDIGKPVRR